SPTLWPCNSFFFFPSFHRRLLAAHLQPRRRSSQASFDHRRRLRQPCRLRHCRRVAPVRTTASCLHRAIAPQSRHRVPIAPPRRPVAPLRSHRTLRLLDAAGLRTTGTAELPPPLAASRRLAPFRCSALRTHRRAHCASAPSLTAHLARICATSPATPLLRHRSRLRTAPLITRRSSRAQRLRQRSPHRPSRLHSRAPPSRLRATTGITVHRLCAPCTAPVLLAGHHSAASSPAPDLAAASTASCRTCSSPLAGCSPSRSCADPHRDPAASNSQP
ncbi:hypothetical protein U1Q18_047565, partial [Sarracenia purpurea var. burkii]